MKNILITGAQGYIGSVLVPYLYHTKKYNIRATDSGLYEDCTHSNYKDPIKILKQDIRDIDEDIFSNIDQVIHLAAVCNDPIGDFNPDITYDINVRGTLRVAEIAKKKGVKRFIFSSSCIMYGASSNLVVDETASLDPKTAYAESKVLAEKELSLMANTSFSPIYLRNGTVYGYSPRMRFDTVLNNFVESLYFTNQILIKGNGLPWRPIVHVQDVCRSIEQFIDFKENEIIHNQAYNNGSDDLNYRIKDLAEDLCDKIINASFEILNQGDADVRTYKASFNKIKKLLPNFEFENKPIDSGVELLKILNNLKIDKNIALKFYRLKTIKNKIDKKILDKNFYYL